jgi:hypothetical protein
MIVIIVSLLLLTGPQDEGFFAIEVVRSCWLLLLEVVLGARWAVSGGSGQCACGSVVCVAVVCCFCLVEV